MKEEKKGSIFAWDDITTLWDYKIVKVVVIVGGLYVFLRVSKHFLNASAESLKAYKNFTDVIKQ